MSPPRVEKHGDKGQQDELNAANHGGWKDELTPTLSAHDVFLLIYEQLKIFSDFFITGTLLWRCYCADLVLVNRNDVILCKALVMLELKFYTEL